MASALSPKWLNSKGVGIVFGIKEKRLKKMRQNGLIESRQEGNRYLYSVESLEAYVNAGSHKPKFKKIYIDRVIPIIEKEVGQKEAIDSSPNSTGGGNNMPRWKPSYNKEGAPNGHYWLNLGDLTIKEIQGKRGIRYEVDFRKGESRPTRSLPKLCGQPVESREEALGALPLVRHKLYEEAKEPNKPNGDVTFTQFVPIYLEEKRNDRERSFKGLESAVLNQLEPFFGSMLLKDITLETVKRYRNRRRRHEVKDISIWKNELNLLKEIYNLAIDHGHKLGPNPVNSRKLKFHIKERFRYMLPEEKKIIWPLLKKYEPLEDLSDFILNTAMRPDNMCEMRWGWVRWDEKRVIVPKEYHKQKNIGRYLLNSMMINMLKRRQKEAGDCPYVFWRSELGSDKRHKVTTRWVQYKWAMVIDEAGIKDLHFYDLKHSCLSKLAAMGANVFVLKAVSNHASTASLERYVKPEACKESALDFLNRMSGSEESQE